MPGHGSLVNEENLRFFGQVAASISHELKNALSVINEGAGLLEDLAAMSARGTPFDPGRLAPLGEKIRRQVRRADLIVKRMNRFAHTAEAEPGPVDLGLLLCQVCELAERLAAMRGVALDVEPAGEPVCVLSSPFRLQNAVWLCLDAAMQSGGPGAHLQVGAAKTAAGASIRIRAPARLSRPSLERLLPADRLGALLDGLGAELVIEEGGRVLALALPQDAGAF